MAPQATCFPDLFFHQVRRLGDRVALRHKDYGIWNRISWKAFGQKVRDVAAGLLSYGVSGSVVVALTKRVSTLLFASVSQLGEEAADSSLVQERGSEQQGIIGMFITYRF